MPLIINIPVCYTKLNIYIVDNEAYHIDFVIFSLEDVILSHFSCKYNDCV